MDAIFWPCEAQMDRSFSDIPVRGPWALDIGNYVRTMAGAFRK